MNLRQVASQQKDSIIITCFSVVGFSAALAAVAEQVYIPLVAIICLISLLFVLFVPNTTPFLLMASNFFGISVLTKGNISLNISDIGAIIFILSALIPFVRTIHQHSLTKPYSGIIILLSILLVVGSISFFVNITTFTYPLMITSVWFLFKFSLILCVFVLFGLSQMPEKFIERSISFILILSLSQFPIGLIQYTMLKSANAINSRFFVNGTLSDHHSMLGTFLLLPLTFAAYRFFSSQRISLKLWYSLMMIIFVFVIILSGSRSALLGIAGALLVFGIMQFRFRKSYIYLSIVFCIVIYFFYSYTPLKNIVSMTLKSRETNLSMDMSSASRLIIWKGAWEYYKKADPIHKLFGVGMGAFSGIQYDMTLWFGSRSISGAHNNFLHVLSETGLVGLFIFLALFGYILFYFFQNRKYILARLFFLATISMLLSGISQETFWMQSAFHSLWLFYMFCVVIAIKSTEQRKESIVLQS